MGGDTLFYGIHHHILAQDFTGIPSALIVEAIAVRHHQTEQRIGAGTGANEAVNIIIPGLSALCRIHFQLTLQHIVGQRLAGLESCLRQAVATRNNHATQRAGFAEDDFIRVG